MAHHHVESIRQVLLGNKPGQQVQEHPQAPDLMTTDTGPVIALQLRGRDSHAVPDAVPTGTTADRNMELVHVYLKARDAVFTIAESTRIILFLLIGAIVFFFSKSAYIFLNDARFASQEGFGIICAVFAPLLTLVLFVPMLWFNTRAAALQLEMSRRSLAEVPWATQRLLTELVRDYPMYYPMFGIQLTPTAFAGLMASILAPGATKLIQLLSQ
jgi:hypothetical protein